MKLYVCFRDVVFREGEGIIINKEVKEENSYVWIIMENLIFDYVMLSVSIFDRGKCVIKLYLK